MAISSQGREIGGRIGTNVSSAVFDDEEDGDGGGGGGIGDVDDDGFSTVVGIEVVGGEDVDGEDIVEDDIGNDDDNDDVVEEVEVDD